MRGGARWPHARRTPCTLSVRLRGRVRQWRGPGLTSTRRLHHLPYHSVRRVFPSTAARPALKWRLPTRLQVKPAPGIPLSRVVCLHSSCPRRGHHALALCREVLRLMHRRARGYPRYPRGPRSGSGCVVPRPHRLSGPIRPTRRHRAISPPCGLYAWPCLGRGASAAIEWFRAFPARSVPTCRPRRPRGVRRLRVPSSFTDDTGLRPLAKSSALPSDPQSASRGAAFSRLSWFAPLQPVGWLASLDGSDHARAWPPETFTPGLPTGRSPFPPPSMTTVATGQFPPAGLTPAGTSGSIAAPPTKQMGLFQQPASSRAGPPASAPCAAAARRRGGGRRAERRAAGGWRPA